ncbi:minor tail protein [Microbacterium phage Cen1621]|uniref:Minor tail protein n=1 Tax=Microbacterium phage Cen1621 TaxID=2965191 RepID=A0A9E7TXM5_9CAUD|nr:minor tail protein [Microbacterium phage Cen1621]
MAQVALSLIAPSGHELKLASSPWDAGAFRVMDGTQGLGLPRQQASFTESAGDGRRVGSIRTSGRTISLALGIFESSRDAVAARLDELADAVMHVDGKPLPKLRATYPDGSAREIEFVLAGGGEEGLTGLGELTARPLLTLECPTAYFTDTQYRDFTIAQTNDGVTFLESLPRAYLQPSDALGEVTVDNPGKVPSWVEWELRGPFTRVEASYLGEGWAFEDALAAGEVVTITKTAAGIRVIDATGASRYSSLSDVPRFFQLPPGKSTVSVDVDGTTEATRVIGRYKPRYRQVF